MPSVVWLRIKLFIQRLWQPTSACMLCMPGSLGNVWSVVHWASALTTGLATGLLAVALSFALPLGVYRNRYGNAVIVGVLTALGDAYAHRGHDGGAIPEAMATGCVSALLALAGSFLFEDRARRIRGVWLRLRGSRS